MVDDAKEEEKEEGALKGMSILLHTYFIIIQYNISLFVLICLFVRSGANV